MTAVPIPELVDKLVEKLGSKHVMLSYNWGVQDMVIKVFEILESKGLPIWMDVKGGVYGNINAAMAKGVEGAMVICPFMTEAYETSEACELELNYAKDRKVQIVPCMAQERVEDGSAYRASGWLGVITAGKLWIDFTGHEGQWEARADQLIGELASKLLENGGRPGKIVKPPAKATPAPAPVEAAAPAPVYTPPPPAAPALRNIALTRPAFQSSVGWGGDPNRAVDGNTDGNYGAASTSHTGDQGGSMAWWYVDLDAPYKISYINVYNRTDSCQKRLDGAEIFVEKALVGRVCVIDDVPMYRFECHGKVGKRIGVTLNTGQYLSLAEVEVMSTGETGEQPAEPQAPPPAKPAAAKPAAAKPAAAKPAAKPAAVPAKWGALGSWNHIGGKLVRVSVGGKGIWGCNKQKQIYYWDIGEKKWVKWPRGELVDISVGGSSIWCIDPESNIWADGKKQDGAGVQISCSQKNNVWGVNSADNIYRREGGKWHQVDGALKCVSVGPSGVWGCNKSDQIFYRKGTYGDVGGAGNSWQKIDGALQWISSGNEMVIGCNSGHDVYIREGICANNPTGTNWKKMSGKLKQVDIFNEHVWGVNANDDIFYACFTKGPAAGPSSSPAGEGYNWKSKKIALKSYHGKWMSAQSNGKVEVNRDKVQAWEIFEVVTKGSTVFFKSCHNKYLSANPNGSITWDKPHMQGWETFTVQKAGADKIYIKSSHNKYASTQKNNSLECNRDKAQGWEEFTIKYM